MSELSALEPTPSSYSTLEDSVCTAELSVAEECASAAAPKLEAESSDEDGSLREALKKLRLSNTGSSECGIHLLDVGGHQGLGGLSNGVSHDETENLSNGTEQEELTSQRDRTDHGECESLPNGTDYDEDLEVMQDEPPELVQASSICERACASVDLQLSCELDISAGTAGVLEDTLFSVGMGERLGDDQSAENLRALCEIVASDSTEQQAEAANGLEDDDDDDDDEQETAVSGCHIVISPEPDCEPGVSNASNDEDEDSRPQRVRRCSSLKTGKTPPGTPGRKKIVRFADVLGLDLADVRTFLDEIPKIPSSAYDDLRDVDPNLGSSPPSFTSPLTSLTGSQQSMGFAPTTTLVPLFPQPWTQPDFLDRVRDRQVCLESATLQDPVLMSLSGVVRVRNLDFHKSVFVRYTTDGWRSWADVAARYVDGSCDGFSDRFTFVLYAHALPAGGRLELAVRFQCRGAQHWDNNGGANYAFQCVATAAAPALEPLSPVDDRWPSFY